MHHSEKARLKHQSHTGVGYTCNPVVSTEEESYFYSSFDGLFRKHVFRENDAFIRLVTSHDYLVATIPEPPVVEEPRAEKTPEEVREIADMAFKSVFADKLEPAPKPVAKKKPGRKKKNVE